MTGHERSEKTPLSEADREVLQLVSDIILGSGLALKFNRALTKLKEERRRSGTLIADFHDPYSPNARFTKAVFGSDPMPASVETFFAVRINPPVEEEPEYQDTLYSIVQVDSYYGIELGGSEIFVGSRAPEGQLKIHEHVKNVFTIEDLILVSELGEDQASIGFSHKFY